MEERRIVDAHAVDLLTRWWPTDAEDPPKGVVLISHGASEHGGRYDRFARALNAAGYAAAAVDHRGHGGTGARTGPGPAIMGPGGGEAVLDDLHELRRHAADRFGGDVPTFFFGHSLGSIIGFGYLAHHSEGLAGAILCGFAADPGDTATMATLLQAAVDGGMRDEPIADLVANTVPEGGTQPRTRFDWLSRDDAEVDAYIADPYCGDGNPLTYGYLLDLFSVVGPAADRLDEIQCPVLVIAGDQDPAAGMGAYPTKLAESLAAAGRTVELTLYEGARHELLNETNREEVTADVVAWLERHTP